jgi:ABC-2 type transport system ATP-binding protein
MTEMIGLDGLTKRFGNLVAVDGISLSVARGEVLGFLGPNGAGKTTAMRMVAGFLEPTAGTARVCGFDVGARPIEVKRRLGYLPEGAPIYGDMTCAAFLRFIAEIRGFRGDELRKRTDHAIDVVSLHDVLDQPVETLSKGFKRRVGLAQAILHDPEVLILDEPTDGLDPNQKYHVRELIRSMAADKAIVVSTHILEEVEAVCTRAVVIDRGRLVADGTSESLLQRLPLHNAVAVTVPAGEAQAARSALATLEGTGGLRDGKVDNGLATLHVLPRDGRNVAAEVAHRLKSENITVEGLYVERGRLDDVFRALTGDDTSGEVRVA